MKIDILVSRRLLLKFFISFGQFEYALKRSGRHVRQNSVLPYDAKPDWDTFASEVRGVFRKERTKTLRQACEYLLLYPPEKQMIAAGGVAWQTACAQQNGSEVEQLLICVRRIRNNLFHGAKFQPNQNFTRERTTKLLQSSLVILKECLRLSPHVRAEYETAAL